MLRLILAELLRRRGRAIALVAGVALATAAFTVLTGASRTARLEARGEVAKHFRTAYDVLVRPAGSRELLERRDGLVQSTALSSLTGGISMAQLRQVRDVPGVEVAAPLAVFGQVVESVPVTIPLNPPADRRSLFRAAIRWTADDGLTRVRDPDSYTYVTPRRLTFDTRGSQPNGQEAAAAERLGNGQVASVCPYELTPEDALGPFSPVVRSKIDCWSTRTGLGGLGDLVPDGAPDRVGATVRFAFALPIAGIDPVAEARLSGLDRARTTGRFLTDDDAPRLRHVGIGRMDIPVVLSHDLPSSLSARVRVERLPDALADRIPAVTDARQLRRLLAAAPGRPTPRATTTIGARRAYDQLVAALRTRDSVASWPDALWTVGPVRYSPLGSRHLRAVPAASQDDEWASPFAQDGSAGYLNPPVTAADVPYRELTERMVDRSADHPVPTLRVVGMFSPDRAPQAGTVLDPFTVPVIKGATDAARATLDDGPLRPDGNPAGLVGLPPMMLTTLAARKVLFNDTYVDGGSDQAATPLALIRVRVADVHGADAASRERIRLVADRIRQKTGLEVDITAGASPTTVRVDAPAGRFGRPALSLSDPWVLKGVAVSVLRAVDRKSVLLFSLVLVVCVLFCLSAAAAAVRQRATELGILACVGWPRRSLLRLLLTEITVLGVAAGVLGLAIAISAGAAFGLSVTVARAAAAVPVAALVSVLAALVPLVRATRADPLNAVRPPARAPRRRGGAGNLLRLAVANTLAVPGRALLGALGLAVGVLALTMLLAVTLAFRGAVVGTVLGDAVSVQVRSIDYVSVGVTLALGVFGLADVLYLNVRDRAAELATLRATGWPERAIGRMVALEGLMIGAAGGLAGAAAGLLAARLFTGRGVGDLLAPAALGVVAGAACAALAAVAPILSLRRLPTARLLAEE